MNEVEKTIIKLKDEGEFRYYLLSKLKEMNKQLTKMGKALINIGKINDTL